MAQKILLTRSFVLHVYAWSRERSLRLRPVADAAGMTVPYLNYMLGRGRPLSDSALNRQRAEALARATGWRGAQCEAVEIRPVEQ